MYNEVYREVTVRISKDKVINNGGKQMINFIENKGWVILNGYTKGDEEGEYTFLGARGSSVIDYIIVNEKVWDKIVEFKIESRVDSDHAPVCAYLRYSDKEEMGSEINARNGKEEPVEKQIITRGEEDILEFKSATAAPNNEEQVADTIENRWRSIKRIMHDSVRRKIIKVKNGK